MERQIQTIITCQVNWFSEYSKFMKAITKPCFQELTKDKSFKTKLLLTLNLNFKLQMEKWY